MNLNYLDFAWRFSSDWGLTKGELLSSLQASGAPTGVTIQSHSWAIRIDKSAPVYLLSWWSQIWIISLWWSFNMDLKLSPFEFTFRQSQWSQWLSLPCRWWDCWSIRHGLASSRGSTGRLLFTLVYPEVIAAGFPMKNQHKLQHTLNLRMSLGDRHQERLGSLVLGWK